MENDYSISDECLARRWRTLDWKLIETRVAG